MMQHSKKILSALLASMLLVSVSASANEAGYVTDPVARAGTAVVYNYSPDEQFLVNTRLGYVTDVELRPGEEIQKIAAGNTVQFSVEKDSVAGVSHVYIKPVSSSVTNFIINTSERSYRLIVTTYNDDQNFIIRWNYPNEDEQARLLALRQKTEEQQAELARTIKAIERAKSLHKEYKVTKNKNVIAKYIPRSVFDDGHKTYIEIAPDNTQNMPVVFYFDDYDKSKLQLVNYRLKGNWMEIDRVMDHIKLAFSQKSYLVFEKQDEDAQNVPSPSKIVLNTASNEDLAASTVNAGKLQQKQVDFHDEAPISLKQKMDAERERKQIALVKAAAASSQEDISLDRLADILEADDAANGNDAQDDNQGDEENGQEEHRDSSGVPDAYISIVDTSDQGDSSSGSDGRDMTNGGEQK